MRHSTPATVTVRTVTHHCSDCGAQIASGSTEGCSEHPDAAVESILSTTECPITATPRTYTGRVRAVSAESIAARLAAKAIATGKWQYDAEHGGSVANKYGYATDTETVIAVASPDGNVYLRFSTLPANKVTHGGVGGQAGARAIWDGRYGKGPAVTAAYAHLRAIHAAATGYVSAELESGVGALAIAYAPQAVAA